VQRGWLAKAKRRRAAPLPDHALSEAYESLHIVRGVTLSIPGWKQGQFVLPFDIFAWMKKTGVSVTNVSKRRFYAPLLSVL
jgi:hypothetical protein